MLAACVAALAILELGIFAAFAAIAREAGHGWRSTLVIAGVSTWVISKLMRRPVCPACDGSCARCRRD